MAARRVSLPSADDLFRATGDGRSRASGDGHSRATGDGQSRATKGAAPDTKPKAAKGGTSGRVRHDEKMTVYVTSDELLELEHARLTLRSKHGLAVDRGRLVREAVAIVLADLESNGEQSTLVRRLAGG